MASVNNGPHDVGGKSVDIPLDVTTDPPLQHWEYSTHALLIALSTKSPPLMSTDELRRSVEGLEENAYKNWSYYAKWGAAMANILLERGVISETELNTTMFGSVDSNLSDIKPFSEGDIVRVYEEDNRSRWRKPHLRCPGYVFGKVGQVVRYIGQFEDPSLLAFRGKGPKQHLYTVAFTWGELWAAPCELDKAHVQDTITLEVYHSWLSKIKEPVHSEEMKLPHTSHSTGDSSPKRTKRAKIVDTDSGHNHGHVHESREDVETIALDREGLPNPGEMVSEALLRLLYSKNIVTPSEIRQIIENIDSAGKELSGAKLVVKSWLDPAFKERLLSDGTPYIILL